LAIHHVRKLPLSSRWIHFGSRLGGNINTNLVLGVICGSAWLYQCMWPDCLHQVFHAGVDGKSYAPFRTDFIVSQPSVATFCSLFCTFVCLCSLAIALGFQAFVSH
jgi:hypothetical protein